MTEKVSCNEWALHAILNNVPRQEIESVVNKHNEEWDRLYSEIIKPNRAPPKATYFVITKPLDTPSDTDKFTIPQYGYLLENPLVDLTFLWEMYGIRHPEYQVHVDSEQKLTHDSSITFNHDNYSSEEYYMKYWDTFH